jgi:dTMP kinase
MPRDETKMKRGHLICFMGIDGSGKSTLARLLERQLKIQGIDCRYLWWLEAEDSTIRKVLRKVSLKNLRISRGVVATQRPGGFLVSLYKNLVSLDYLRHLVLHVWIPMKLGSTIICDRYIYDTLVAFAVEFDYQAAEFEKSLKLLLRLAPRPDILFLVDVPLEVAVARKSDIPSHESLIGPRRMYLEMARHMNVVMIDGTQSLESLAVRVLENVKPIVEDSK